MKRRDNTAKIVGTVVGSLAVVAASQVAFAEPVHYDIPAGDAAKTLQDYLQQTRIEMLYLTEEVRGIATHAIQGDIEPTKALAQLLAGTGLDFTFTPDLTFATVKLHEESVPEGPDSDAARASTSEASIRNPASRSRQLSCGSCEEELQEVLVTGTLIHGVRDIAAPLEIIDRQRARTARANSVKEVIEALPIARGSGISEDVGGIGNYSRGTAINLRGLGPSATLVLIDGRRQPTSGGDGDFVDVSSVPFSAIERVEVLPDGASAIYGSDAVAGVVNIIMRKNAPGQVTTLSYDAGEGGGAEKYVSQLLAGNWSSGHVMATFEARDVGDLAASARPYARSADKRSFGGSDFRTIFSSPGNLFNPLTLQPIGGIRSTEPGRSATADDLLPDLHLGDRWAQPQMELLPERRSRFGFVTASQSIGSVDLFATARFTTQRVSQTLSGFQDLLEVPRSNPYVGALAQDFPFALVAYDFAADLGPVGVDSHTQTFATELGANFKLPNHWHAVLAGSFGSEKMEYTLLNNVDEDALAKALASPDPATAFNPFSPGSTPESTIDTIRLDQPGNTHSRVRAANLVFDGPVLNLATGTASLAVGGEVRNESLERTLPSEGRFARSVRSLFAEATVPLIGSTTSDGNRPRLDFSASARYDDYSDSGNTLNPRATLRITPNDSFKLRATLGRSFRAPKLVDESLAGNVNLLTTLTDPKAASGRSVVLALLGNNPALRPETARTWNVGFDLAPAWAPGLTASVTYFRTNYRNRIAGPAAGAQAEILLAEDTWADVIQRDPSAAAVASVCDEPGLRGSIDQCKSAPVSAIVDFRLRNLAATRIDGLDFKIQHRLPTRFGVFDSGLNASYLHSFQQATSNRSAWVDLSNTVGNPPRFRGVVNADWYRTRWDGPGPGVSLTVSRTGAYRDSIAPGPSVSAYTTADVRLSYRTQASGDWLSSTEFSLKVSNLFDSGPPFANRETGYDAYNFDPTARSISFGLEKQW